MEFETYADVIDAFERDNMGYETLTDYIRDQNIQIKEIDMDPLGDLKKTFAYGGIADNTKTYHQIHDYTAPPDLESVMGYANGGGVGSMMQPKKKNYKDQKLTAAQKKNIKPANQGGGPNYLGKEETVTVPKKWLSDPNHVVAELAYITPKEQKILLDENLYGSLKGKPNKGPSGVMSLQGDLGGWSSGSSGSSSGAGSGNTNQGKGGRSTEDYKNTDYYKMMTGQLKKTSPLMHSTTAPGPKTKKYAVPEYVKVKQLGGGYKDKYIGSGYKSYGQPSFFGNLFSRGAPGYRGIKGMPAFWGKPGFEAKQGPQGFGYYSDKENFGETRDAVPFGIMGIISNMLNKFKKPKDMTESNKYGLGGSKNYIPAGTLDFDPNAKINVVPQRAENAWSDGTFTWGDNKTPPANVNVNNDMQSYLENESNYMGPVTGVNYPGGAPNQMQEFLSDEQNYVGPVTGVNYPGGAPNVMQEYMDDQTNTGNMIDPRYVTEEMGLQGDGSYGLELGTPFNNPVGGVDQYAKEMEALEKMADGVIMPVSNMGGTLQDFYTNKNPGTNANTLMQVYDDNINFNNQASLPGNNNIINSDLAPEFQNLVTNVGAYDTPTEGLYGLNLIETSKLQNLGYNNDQIKEAVDGGYAEDIIKSIDI